MTKIRRELVLLNSNLNTLFTEEYLKQYFFNHIRYKKVSTGIDRVTLDNFSKHLPSQISCISRKINDNTYKFTNYRGISISKGYNKYPRVISIPTVRDSLVLTIVSDYLTCFFEKHLKHQEIVQTKISKMALKFNNYNLFLKIDMRAFFDTIPHDILIKKLEMYNIDKTILYLVTSALKKEIRLNNDMIPNKAKGVFQGLSIANILAEIYMIDIDEEIMALNTNFAYFRYVDDIIIMINEDSNFDRLKFLDTIKEIFSKQKLEINEQKTDYYENSKSFDYLGYQFYNNKIGIRKSTVLQFEQNIENTLKDLKLKKFSDNKVLWFINLKITGFIVDNGKYGWMFFFSQITNLTVLSHLDNYVEKLLIRFGLDTLIGRVKKFMRTYNEIYNNLNNTKYIINFSKLSIDDKRVILINYFEYHKDAISSDDSATVMFNKEVNRLKKDFQKDVQHISQ